MSQIVIKGSEIRKADFPIEPMLLDRWSPRAMSGEEIPQDELMRLFEAARWAPSSFNAQQWRALYARRGSEHWRTFLELLVEANKSWAKNSAVLIVFARPAGNAAERTVIVGGSFDRIVRLADLAALHHAWPGSNLIAVRRVISATP